MLRRFVAATAKATISPVLTSPITRMLPRFKLVQASFFKSPKKPSTAERLEYERFQSRVSTPLEN